MKYGSVPGISLSVSRLVLGSVIAPRTEDGPWFDLMDRAFALGVDCFDTAHTYADGDSERVIGRWMKSRGNRDRMAILTKCSHHSQDRKRVTPFDIAADLFDSLSRLDTPYVDMLILHRDDPGVPVGPIVEALHEHWEAGRVRAYGGSNWTWKRMNEANDYAASHGLHPFTVSSQHFSLAEQVNDPWGGGCVSVAGPNEAEARAWHVSSGIPLFAYASLSGGFFSGRFSRESFESMKAAGKIGEDCLRAYCYPRNFDRQDRAIELAAMKGLSLPQIAISYVVSHAEHGIIDVHALVGAGSPEELETDVAGAELLLSRSEIEWLDLRRDSLD